ncbi:MAG: hypothetical protein LC135_02365 [Phycisphaerae bacterium]|nr:hypothetical protein [Phycisphaerae bacterium]
MPGWLAPALAVTLLASAAPARAEIDLASRYPAALDYAEQPVGREWVSTEQDVWRLSRLAFEHGTELKLMIGPCTVVFGRHDTSVLWAAVFPDAPGLIDSHEAGDGDQIATLWLRFHPAEVGRLFPPGTVIGPGPAERLRAGKRLAAWKMSASWQANGLPVVPTRGTVIADIDTPHPLRRFYHVPGDGKAVSYVDAFERRPLPRDTAVDRESAVKAFNEVWEAFDREYAMFAIKEDVDWAALRKRFAPLAEGAHTCYELAAVLADMLAKLEDLHVWVRCGDEHVASFHRPRPLNASFQALRAAFKDLQQPSRDLAWSKTDDGIGYVAVLGLGDQNLPDHFDEALAQLHDAWSLIVDLRFNGGGDELLARKMAGRFLDRGRVYSLNQFRSGPAHTDLGERLERACEPRGPWRFESPVVVLTGQRTMSSAESFVLMLAQCPQVTTLGDRTAGSSGNARLIEPGCGIKVALPRWLDMDPDGRPIDAVGIAPKVKLDARPDDFTAERDPVLEAALQRLREQPAGERKPGRR